MASRDTFTAEVPKEIVEDPDYVAWESDLNDDLLGRVMAARESVENEGVVTSAKALGDGLYEKKWHSGLRLYFAVIEQAGKKTLLLLGSGKGKDQDRAITASKKKLASYKVFTGNIAKKD